MSLNRYTGVDLSEILRWQAKYWRGQGQRRKSVHNFGGTDIENIVESASAEGARLRLPKASRPSRLGVWEGVVSGVWGRAPEDDAIFKIL